MKSLILSKIMIKIKSSAKAINTNKAIGSNIETIARMARMIKIPKKASAQFIPKSPVPLSQHRI